jgi:DNA-binding NarL/FixJ family response regulator
VIGDLTPIAVGVALVGSLRRVCHATHVLVFTQDTEIGVVRSALAAAVTGYALKQSNATVVLEALATTDNAAGLDTAIPCANTTCCVIRRT